MTMAASGRMEDHAPMRAQPIRTVSLVLWLPLFTASPAVAQGINVNVLSFQGRDAGTFDLADLGSVVRDPITSEECASGSIVELRFTNIDPARATLEWFRGSACDDPSARNDVASTSCDPLAIDPVTIGGRTQVDVGVRVGSLVPCELDGAAGVEPLWVLALDNAADSVSAPGQSASFLIAYDFARPAPPNASYVADETTFEVTTDGGATRYELFLDPVGCTDGVPTSDALMDPPDPRISLAIFASPTGSFLVAWPDTVSIPGDAAIAIRAIDAEGRAGALSEPTCVQRVEDRTSGGCSAAPSRPRGTPWLGGLALLLLFARRASLCSRGSSFACARTRDGHREP
jgi:hypothetical protein